MAPVSARLGMNADLLEHMARNEYRKVALGKRAVASLVADLRDAAERVAGMEAELQGVRRETSSAEGAWRVSKAA